MIEGMFSGGALPVLERMVQFTEARHTVLTHNIANVSTPYFKPSDLDPARFQTSLREAIKDRRSNGGPLQFRDTRQIRFRDHSIETHPDFRNENILFHDRNSRDLERMMQDLVENTMTHNMAVEMLRHEFEMIRTAIRGRI